MISLTPAEHAYAVVSYLEASACTVRVRGADGQHLLDAEAHADATNAIRATSGETAVKMSNLAGQMPRNAPTLS